MQIENAIDSLSYTIKSCKDLLNKEKSLKENAQQLEKNLKEKEEYLKFCTKAINLYKVAIDELYEESVKSLSETLNTALQYVFYDKNYKCKLVVENKRGTKTLDIFLIDEDDGLEIDVKNGVGNGIRVIISFCLKAYYLLNMGSKTLFLDEKYGMLSSHYTSRFFDFIESFCTQNDFIIVMISHIDNQIEHADKVYYLNDGVITEGEAVKE